MVYQRLRRIQHLLFASSCIACGERGNTALLDLCGPCRAELPLNRRCCQVCAIPLQLDAVALCGECLQRTPRYRRSYCAYEYAYPIPHFVRALKYQNSLSQARVLGELLAHYLLQQHTEPWPACFIPVPLSTTRHRERGYNQVLELGRFVERKLKIPMHTQWITRVRDTAEQAGLSRRERRKNLRDAFVVDQDAIPQHVAILDDVVTTGSTVNEVARVLQRAGVEHIEVWAVARAALR